MEASKPNGHKPWSQHPKPAIQTFEFITLTDNHKIEEHDRYTVRKQAMKNNTNRRIKGAKHPSAERDVKSENLLTGPPVIQQALQSKRFRLLPRGLQDLEDNPKMKDSTVNASGSKTSGLMQTYEFSPVDFPEEMVRSDSMLEFSTSNEWTDLYLEESQIVSEDNGNSVFDITDGILGTSWASQHPCSYQFNIPISLDPLSFLPDNIPPRARLLIQHNFAEHRRATSLMLSVRKSWLTLSLTDIAFFNVVLSHYAGTYSLLTGQGDPMESHSFTAASIKIINQRLDSPDQRTSDGTIAAVAGMVLQETKNGNSVAAKAHLSGLKLMISLRGGLLKANFPAPLQRMIAWAELHASSIFSTTPHIIPYTSPSLSIPSYICTSRPSGPILPSSPCPNPVISWETIDIDLSQIFIDLRYISSILDSDDPKAVEQIDNMWYSDKTYLIQRSLVYCYQFPPMSHSRLDSLTCLAASIYVDSCLRDQRFSAGAIGILVSRLKSELVSFLLSYDDVFCEHGEERERTLLWICVFGGIVAFGWPERGWFVEQFVEVCGRLGLKEWEQVEGALWERLWNGRWEDPKGQLWREAVQVKEDLNSSILVEVQ